ncbi:hypothetical protein ACFFHJ_40940 [Planotetraspora thailandica]|uniref:hypothetical protein n=1 Tax=Planotetraspora thailandica TaxID=487172 RepID=UPI00194ED6D9|nr:hypothetical protein [Planotetraspora thailandica]
MAGNPLGISLEKAAQEFVDAPSEPPFLYQLAPEAGRKAVDGVQDSPIFKPGVDEEWISCARRAFPSRRFGTRRSFTTS